MKLARVGTQHKFQPEQSPTARAPITAKTQFWPFKVLAQGKGQNNKSWVFGPLECGARAGGTQKTYNLFCSLACSAAIIDTALSFSRKKEAAVIYIVFLSFHHFGVLGSGKSKHARRETRAASRETRDAKKVN